MAHSLGYAEDLFTQLPAGAQAEARPITVGEREAVTAEVTDGQRWWCSWLVEPDGDRLVLTVRRRWLLVIVATVCITGGTDGIGLATARRLLAAGHRVLVHARSEDRGRPVMDGLDGDAVLVTGDLARLSEVRSLAEQIADNGPLDVLIHNAGVWVRGGTPRVTPDGFETTFAVNVLAPHLLTGLLVDRAPRRLLWLGSGLARSGRVRPEALGRAQDPRTAYADSKACDVALALAWGRRLPGTASVAIDPGWVSTKLATLGAPGDPGQSAVTLAYCSIEADLTEGAYWRDRRPIPVPSHLRDPALTDELAAACDRLSGL